MNIGDKKGTPGLADHFARGMRFARVQFRGNDRNTYMDNRNFVLLLFYIQNTVYPEKEVRRKRGSLEKKVRFKKFEMLSVSILEYSEHRPPNFSLLERWKCLYVRF